MTTPVLDDRPRDWDQPEPPDRYALLVTGGVLLLLAAAACVLFSAVTVLGLVMSRWYAGGQQLSQMIPGLVGYTGGAGLLTWAGIGSLMARRWAPAVIVAGSVVWLVRGLLALVVACVAVPYMLESMPRMAAGQPEWAGMLAATTMVGMTAVGGVIVPALLLALYARRSVRQTCEQRDPTPRWTDGRPLAVLTLAAALATEGAGDLLAATAGAPNVLFGRPLFGAWALAAALGSAGVAAIVALDLCRLKRWAWWGSLVYIAGWALSVGLAINVDLATLYEKMGYGAEWSSGSWGAFASFMSRAQMTAALAGALVWLVLAARQWRHFRPGRPPAAETPAISP